MVRRVVFAVLLAALVTACDSYVEQIEVGGDGSARLRARAQIFCGDPLQIEIWGRSPCEAADDAVAGADPGLPFGSPSDSAGLVIETSGGPQRTIDLSWDGQISELPSALVATADVRTIDETTRELTLVPAGAVVPDFLADEESAARVAEARWPAAELRVVAPDLIVDHNADEIAGRTVVWQIDGDQPDVLIVRWTLEDPPRQYWWWLVASVLLTGVLFMMVVLEGSRGRNDDRGQIGSGDGSGGNGR